MILTHKITLTTVYKYTDTPYLHFLEIVGSHPRNSQLLLNTHYQITPIIKSTLPPSTHPSPLSFHYHFHHPQPNPITYHTHNTTTPISTPLTPITQSHIPKKNTPPHIHPHIQFIPISHI